MAKHPLLIKIFKIIGIILLIIAITATGVYFLVLNYPEIKSNPRVAKWYRVSSEKMKDSEGSSYHALFKKGSEKKVMVYFAGGGVSIDEQTARNDTYNMYEVKPDMLANLTMNMGGLAVDSEENPFQDWTMILFPYATGDFDAGAGEFKYTDRDGKEKILYHNGYVNFTEAMDEILDKAGISDADTVLVTGYSAGGWAASLLADDVFGTYFPDAASKTVLVDSSVGLNDDWKDIAENVWHSPDYIVERLHTNNITLDSLTALHEKYSDSVNILFDCSTRDGSLAQVQRYFKDRVIDESTSEMPVDESDADIFQQTLKEFVYQLKEQANANIFIFDGYDWYGDPRNMTSHTIIPVAQVFETFQPQNQSICGWLMDTIDGNKKDYGLELLDKIYPSSNAQDDDGN